MAEPEDRVRAMLARASVALEPGDLELVTRLAASPPPRDPGPTAEPALIQPVTEWSRR